MSAALESILDELRRHQVEVQRFGDRLKVRAPVRPPDEVLERARQHKAELLAVLPDLAAPSPTVSRAILRFKTQSMPRWGIALGETREQVIADLKLRLGDDVEFEDWRR